MDYYDGWHGCRRNFGCRLVGEIFWDCVDICILLPRMQILF